MSLDIAAILGALPEAASTPLAFIGYVVAIVGYVVVVLNARKNSKLLHHLEKLPEADRIRALRDEVGIGVPDNVSAEDWIKARGQRYWFFCFAILAAVISLLVAISLLREQPENVSILSNLSSDKWVSRCFARVPEGWSHLADDANPGPVLFEPRVGMPLFKSDFKFIIDILARPVTSEMEESAYERALIHADGQGFHSTCYFSADYMSDKSASLPDAQTIRTSGVRTLLNFEDGTDQGSCLLKISESNATWGASLDWDPILHAYPSGGEEKFVRFTCSASKSLAKSDFLGACQILIERTTNSESGSSFHSCHVSTSEAFVVASMEE